MVLVIDDFVDTCLILQHMLERQGFSTTCATSAEQAESVLKTFTPEVIVMDYTMPDRSGLELLEELQEDEGLAGVPVIMFSALADETLIEHAHQLGADWVVKGRDWNMLLQKVTALHA